MNTSLQDAKQESTYKTRFIESTSLKEEIEDYLHMPHI